jgi:hypothetical protein
MEVMAFKKLWPLTLKFFINFELAKYGLNMNNDDYAQKKSPNFERLLLHIFKISILLF